MKVRLRMDCWADNSRLAAYCEDAGFVRRDTLLFGGRRGQLLEKPPVERL